MTSRKLVSTLLAFSLLLPLFTFPPKTRAGGPCFTQAVFMLNLRPDFPLARFMNGDLGVLQPTYARPYLVVAHRVLYGCGETTELNYSKIVFQIFHKKYPNSEWTKETPYSF